MRARELLIAAALLCGCITVPRPLCLPLAPDAPALGSRVLAPPAPKHLRMTFHLEDGKADEFSIQVGEGQARSYGADPREMGVALQDGKGETIRTLHVADPRGMRVYLDTNLPPARKRPRPREPDLGKEAEPRAGPAGFHAERYQFRRRVVATLVLPFERHLLGVTLIDTRGHQLGRVDLGPMLASFCRARPGDADCAEWLRYARAERATCSE